MQTSSISNFKKFFLRILLPLFIIILSSSYFLYFIFEKEIILKNNRSGIYKINRLISEDNLDEIPIIGSSRAEMTYIPGVISENSYNYGLSGARDNVHLALLEIELAKKRKTPIILNFDPWGMGEAIGDIRNYLYNSDHPKIKELLGKEYKFQFQIPIIKYFGYYENYIKGFVEFKGNPSNIMTGEKFEFESLPSHIFNEQVANRLSKDAVFKNEPIYENKLMTLLKKTDRKVIFVVAPCHKSFFDALVNLDEEESFLNKVDSLNNVLVLNYGLDEFTDEEYFDITHLNYKGAKRFSEKLREDLIKNQIL